MYPRFLEEYYSLIHHSIATVKDALGWSLKDEVQRGIVEPAFANSGESQFVAMAIDYQAYPLQYHV